MKISIIGSGRLGSLFAFEIRQRNLAQELVLVDVVKELAEGHAQDLSHAHAHRGNMRVEAGGYEAIRNSDVVIITAGKRRTPGQTRLDLATSNTQIVAEIAKEIAEVSPNAIAITVTNPMDVMNHTVQKNTGFERERVLGSGGQLDSSRFITILASHLKVQPTSIEAYVLGEHGDLQVPVFSRVKVCGKKVEFSNEEKELIRNKIKQTAIEVIGRKMATEFAPTTCTIDMVEAIVKNQHKLIPCSIVLNGEYGFKGVSIGVPVILGKDGADEILQWELDEYEATLFRQGADMLMKFSAELEKRSF